MNKSYCIPINELAGYILSLLLLMSVTGTCVAAEQPVQVRYAKTIAALQQRYLDEVTAHRKYIAFAKRAEQEDYPNIAHLFRALATSEAVHARNFKKQLVDLGVKANPAVKLELSIASTKDNIQHASTVEAEEIDKEYPQILEAIAAENHEQAIRFITYAWKSEEQHRKMILKIKKASKRFFGLLAGHIEGESNRYYICQFCGSTLTELPTKHCPICEHSTSEYKEVPGFPGTAEE